VSCRVAGKASVRSLERPLEAPGEEAVTGTRGEDAAVAGVDLVARVPEADNLRRARHQVRRHQGAPGIDGMTVDDLGAYVTIHGPGSQTAVLAGPYAPQPVQRTAIPKAGGGTRDWGSPTGLDRGIEPALLQGLQEAWTPTGSERRDGCRPQRPPRGGAGASV
jgi:RNA-directed DNA polymerase